MLVAVYAKSFVHTLAQSKTINEYTIKDSRAMHKSKNKYPTITGTIITNRTNRRPITTRHKQLNMT